MINEVATELREQLECATNERKVIKESVQTGRYMDGNIGTKERRG